MILCVRQPVTKYAAGFTFSCFRNYRYAAYRQFTWWVHDRLGKYVRRVIPACVVKEIRAAFPDSQGNYTGFRTPDESYSEVDLSWIKELV